MLTLEIFDDGGVFRHHNNYDGIVAELDDVLEQREAGTVTPAKYVKRLRALVERYPDLIDGHAHLGYALMEKVNPSLRSRPSFKDS